MDIKFDLQDHLNQMEGRLSSKVDDVHADVKAQNGRVRALEVASERHETRGKWIVRVLGTGSSALMAYLGLHHS